MASDPQPGKRPRLAAVPDLSPSERSCPFGECDGSGWVIGPEDVARACRCRERRISRARTRGVSSVIPRRYRDVAIDRPPIYDMGLDRTTAPVVSAVRAYTEALGDHLSSGRGLWLMGDVGTGKTALAMLVSKLALEAGHSVAIYSMPHLLARVRRTYDAAPGGDSYLEFFERLTTVDLLHLEDLGAERRTDWVIEQLYAIINRRYEEERSVLVTMNDPSLEEEGTGEGAAAKPKDWYAALTERIGERTVSRLVEICGDPLPVYGSDRRVALGG